MQTSFHLIILAGFPPRLTKKNNQRQSIVSQNENFSETQKLISSNRKENKYLIKKSDNIEVISISSSENDSDQGLVPQTATKKRDKKHKDKASVKKSQFNQEVSNSIVSEPKLKSSDEIHPRSLNNYPIICRDIDFSRKLGFINEANLLSQFNKIDSDKYKIKAPGSISQSKIDRFEEVKNSWSIIPNKPTVSINMNAAENEYVAMK